VRPKDWQFNAWPMSHRQTIRIIILALFAVIAGTWIAVKQTTDQLRRSLH